MEAEDTVMHETIIDTFNRYKESILSEDDWDLWGLLEAQAEISFKAGQKAEREVIRGVALNYPTRTAIQIIDNLDRLRPRGGQCADNATYKYDGPEYTR